MARFNAPTETKTQTTNLAGGEAHVQNPELEFVSILLTSMVQDQFYRKADDTLARVIELIPAVGHEFAAKAALFARDEFGMRSISHVVAGELAMRARGEQWTRPFYDKMVVRADDITEILSYVINKHGRRPIPNALKDGLGRALTRMNAYQLGRYRAEGKALSMVDVVNLLHPQPSEAISALVNGTLRSQSWETDLTQAGQNAETEEDKAEAKSAAWAEQVTTGKIGQLALLRNLRNILQDADADTLAAAMRLLVDENRIHRSRIFPFQFQTAGDALSAVAGSKPVMTALEQAMDISCANVPKFEGSTLVVVDESGSMSFARGASGERGVDRSVLDIAAVFAGVLYRSQDDVDLMKFSDRAAYMQPKASNVMGIAAEVRGNPVGRGTDFRTIFPAATRAYDRIVILSDMQGWIGGLAPGESFAAYKRKFDVNPHVYSFDLTGHGTMQFPEHQVYAMAGFSTKVFDVMALLEQDRRALVHKIEAVELA